jgi:hypothetical protein
MTKTIYRCCLGISGDVTPQDSWCQLPGLGIKNPRIQKITQKSITKITKKPTSEPKTYLLNLITFDVSKRK